MGDPLVPAVEIDVMDADRGAILAEIERLLGSGRFSQGENVQRFEEEFAEYVGVPHAVAVASGTVALELTFRALGVEGHEVIVPANTNFATFIAAERAGATVRLCDVDPLSLSPSLADIVAVAGERTAAVALVHMGGVIGPDVDKISAWCADHRVALVEDCAHAHGSRRDDRHAGDFGVAGAFSFFATKVMTSGEGGMVVSRDGTLAEEVRLLRNLGKPQAWTSRHVRPGINGRMHEWAAVIGRRQLGALDDMVAARRRVADEYHTLLRAVPGVALVVPDHPYSGYKVPVVLPAGTDRDALKAALAARGVQAAGEVYEVPLHRQPVLEDRYRGLTFPGADTACARQLCLPIYPTLDRRRIGIVASAFTEACAEVTPG